MWLNCALCEINELREGVLLLRVNEIVVMELRHLLHFAGQTGSGGNGGLLVLESGTDTESIGEAAQSG